MTKVADFFQPRSDLFWMDPRLREVKSSIEAGWSTTLKINHWPGFAFGHNTPEMVVYGMKPGEASRTSWLGWDEDLNQGLIRLHVRAENTEQESDRFSLSLDTAFTLAERVAGDGFFNSVLLDFIRESELDADQAISALLVQIRSVVTLDQQSPKYTRCREIIDAAIRGRALELKDDLGYPMDEAQKILVAAIARYLDRRFSVSLRRQRGSL